MVCHDINVGEEGNCLFFLQAAQSSFSKFPLHFFSSPHRTKWLVFYICTNCCLLPIFHLGVLTLTHTWTWMELDVCRGVENPLSGSGCCSITVFHHSWRRFADPRVEHGVPVIRTSSDQHLREGQLLAVHPGPHLGHNHRDELPGGPARSGVRWPSPILHLLLQWPVITFFHHPGELQLWAVWWPQAQGETEPTALLHGGMSRSHCTSLCGKKKKKKTS